MMTFREAREAARRLFPEWSRKMRAKWVVAKLKSNGPRVAISSQHAYDRSDYFYRRCIR